MTFHILRETSVSRGKGACCSFGAVEGMGIAAALALTVTDATGQ